MLVQRVSTSKISSTTASSCHANFPAPLTTAASVVNLENKNFPQRREDATKNTGQECLLTLRLCAFAGELFNICPRMHVFYTPRYYTEIGIHRNTIRMVREVFEAAVATRRLA